MRDPDLDAIEKKYASSEYYVDEFNDAGIAAIYTPDPSGFSSDLYGVVNRSRKILVPVKYALATVYDDYIVVHEQMNYNNFNRMRGFVVDGSGKTVYEYYSGGGTHADDNAMTVRGYGDGLFSCRDEHGTIKDGYMLPDGTVVIEPGFDIAGDFSDGLAWVQYQGKWGIIKRSMGI